MNDAIRGSGGSEFYRMFKSGIIRYGGAISFTIDGNPISIEIPRDKDDRFCLRNAYYCSAEDVRTLIGRSDWKVGY